MTDRNELLDKDIQERIKKIRYEKPDEVKTRKPTFYIIVVILVTVSVLLSLLRYL